MTSAARDLMDTGTPGPWHWSGDWKHREFRLSSWVKGQGRVTVMDFVRAGMQRAQPRFNVDGLMENAADLVQFEVCHEATEPADRRVYRYDIDDIRHPDARKIVLSVNALPLVDALIEVINNIEAGADGWGACSHEWVQINLLAAARDALEAALRGEGQ